MYISFPLSGPFEIGEEVSYLAKHMFKIRTQIFNFYPATCDTFSVPIILLAVLKQESLLFYKTS